MATSRLDVAVEAFTFMNKNKLFSAANNGDCPTKTLSAENALAMDELSDVKYQKPAFKVQARKFFKDAIKNYSFTRVLNLAIYMAEIHKNKNMREPYFDNARTSLGLGIPNSDTYTWITMLDAVKQQLMRAIKSPFIGESNRYLIDEEYFNTVGDILSIPSEYTNNPFTLLSAFFSSSSTPEKKWFDENCILYFPVARSKSFHT